MRVTRSHRRVFPRPAEIREMVLSGLVEVAAHSYDSIAA